jgi:Flp pilus assembly protein TadD
MFRSRLLAGLLFALTPVVMAQVEQLPQSGKEPGKSEAPPRSDADRTTAQSSSKNTQIDLSPPKDDDKDHPYSGSSVSDASTDSDAGSVQEVHLWDPHRAARDLEVGDYYFKRKNYRAAMDRYQEALEYKPNDAEANFHLAQCYQKLEQPDQAILHYHEYLKILPQGPLAPEAHKALEKLEKPQASQAPEKAQAK